MGFLVVQLLQLLPFDLVLLVQTFPDRLLPFAVLCLLPKRFIVLVEKRLILGVGGNPGSLEARLVKLMHHLLLPFH